VRERGVVRPIGEGAKSQHETIAGNAALDILLVKEEPAVGHLATCILALALFTYDQPALRHGVARVLDRNDTART
jgi:hypothetical protein